MQGFAIWVFWSYTQSVLTLSLPVSRIYGSYHPVCFAKYFACHLTADAASCWCCTCSVLLCRKIWLFWQPPLSLGKTLWRAQNLQTKCFQAVCTCSTLPHNSADCFCFWDSTKDVMCLLHGAVPQTITVLDLASDYFSAEWHFFPFGFGGMGKLPQCMSVT